MRLHKFAALIALLLALPGCTQFIGPGEPPRIFQLTPPVSAGMELPAVDWQLTVSPPLATAALDTTRIAVMVTPNELSYFARAAWADRAPIMVQTVMVEAFENSGRIVGVGRETIGLRPNFALQSELRHFQAEVQPDGSQVIRVTIAAKLIELPGRRILASRLFEERAGAASTELSAVVAAFDEVLGAMTGDLVAWTLEEGEQGDADGRGAPAGGTAAGLGTTLQSAPPAVRPRPAPFSPTGAGS